MSAFLKDQKKTLRKYFLKVIWKVWFVHEYFKLIYTILALILLHISSNIRIFKTILTSLPTRSFLFSITPHGAIPIVQIFRDDLEACSLRASPTCLATPVHTKFNSLHLKVFTVLIKILCSICNITMWYFSLHIQDKSQKKVWKTNLQKKTQEPKKKKKKHENIPQCQIITTAWNTCKTNFYHVVMPSPLLDSSCK